MRLRRLIYRAREDTNTFHIKPSSPIGGDEDASPPAPPPRLYGFQVNLDSDTIEALDRGEVIFAIVANRHCVVRLRDLPMPR